MASERPGRDPRQTGAVCVTLGTGPRATTVLTARAHTTSTRAWRAALRTRPGVTFALLPLALPQGPSTLNHISLPALPGQWLTGSPSCQLHLLRPETVSYAQLVLNISTLSTEAEQTCARLWAVSGDEPQATGPHGTCTGRDLHGWVSVRGRPLCCGSERWQSLKSGMRLARCL